MANWNDGYVSDISYTGAVYREQMPAHLDVACLVAGVVPPVEAGAPFSYCELGCGLGDTALTVAAVNPAAQVWGFDFNPAHVAAGRAVAARTGLSNIALAESSFAELATSPPPGLPPFDYVTLHGVWSWVSPANQAHIVAFLDRHLRPGGLACVSYNAAPGYNGQIGLQRLLIESGRAAGGSSDRRIREGLSLARRLADAGCRAIDEAWLKRLEVMLEQGQEPYLAHEYLNEHWRPVSHTEVAEAMADAKLTYAGSAGLFDNFPSLCVKPEHIALLDSLPPGLRQTAEDALCGRMFRRDIYLRGPRPMRAAVRAERIGAQRLVLTVPPRSTSLTIAIPAGKATLSEAFYGPALATLGRGEASLANLHSAAAPGTAPPREEVLSLLIGAKQAAHVSGEPDAAGLAAVRRFNRARIAIYIEEGQRSGWLAGARIGSAVPVGIDEMLVYEAAAAAEAGLGEDLAIEAVMSDVRALMEARGLSLRPERADAAPDMEADLREIMAERVPIWRAVGAL